MIISLIFLSIINLFHSISVGSLVDYTKKTYPIKDINSTSQFYLLSDPHKYITDKQRYVINHRLKDIFNMFNINIFFFVVDKVDHDVNSDPDETIDENEFDNITMMNRSDVDKEITSNWKKNKTLKSYLNNIAKRVNELKYGNESESFFILYEVNNVKMYAQVGKDIEMILNPNELDGLFEGADIKIQKKDLYHAVDDFLTDFIYVHRPKGFMEKSLGYLGSFSEVFVIGVVIISYLLFGNNDNKDNGAKKEEKKKEDKKHK